MTDVFPTIVYTLCFLTSTLCAYLLARMFFRTRANLLFWSAGCFILLAIANLIVVFDMLIFPEVDFRLIRLGLSFAAVSLLLFGFIWSEE